jgi:hypothetical protein
MMTYIYKIHLKAAQEWGNMWYTILDSILEVTNHELEKKYRTTGMKFKKLEKTQSNNHDFQEQFYPRVINKTDIIFSNEELSLLNKGLKYNLSYNTRNGLKL